MANYKFIKNKPKPNPEKWANRVNFDTFWNGYQNGITTAPKLWQKGAFWAGAAAVAVVATIAIWLGNKSSERQNAQPAETAMILDSTMSIATTQNPLTFYFDSAIIDNTRDTLLICKDGSSIRIPQNSFELTDEQDPTKITFKYRSFQHPVDFIKAGISMQVMNSDNQLESAGMIELRAYAGDAEIELKEQKELEVTLRSRTDAADYKLYELENEEDGWVCIGTDDIQKPSKEANSIPETDEPDVSKLITKKTDTLQTVQTEIRKLENNAPLKPKTKNPDLYAFTIDFRKAEFPELHGFRNISFQVSPAERKFDSKLYKVIWEDIELKKTQKGTYEITLRKGLRTEKFSVWPVINPEDYENEMAKFNTKLETYKNDRTLRKKEEERLEQDLELLTSSKKARDEYHKKNKSTYRKYAKINQSKLAESRKFDDYVERSFSVGSMGVYNCDRIINNTVKTVHLDLKNTDHSELTWNNVYVINSQVNTAYKFTKSGLRNMTYLNSGRNIVITFDEEAQFMFYGFLENKRLTNPATREHTLVLMRKPIADFTMEKVNALLYQISS